MTRFHLPNWAARNPLGIIALFISLIYGMSAALLGASVSQLSTLNQTILVAFIVIFPFVVLGVFAWLVVMHHRKLYGPGDYRSDEGFLNAGSAIPPAVLGERLRQETEVAKSEHSPSESGAIPPSTTVSETLSLYALENLAFQEIQRELGHAIKRGVKIARPSGKGFIFDGLSEDEGRVTFIEVKVIRALSTMRVVLNREVYKYKRLLDEMTLAMAKPAQLLLAFVYVGKLERDPTQWIEEARNEFGDAIMVRFYSSEDLLVKYGFGHQEKEN